MNKEGVKNAAPIGIQCKGLDKLGCRLFVGTHTLANVMETKRYVINITENSLNFVNSTVGNLDADKFTDDEDIAILKDADAYIVCEVTNIEKQDKIKDHVTSHGEAYLVDAGRCRCNRNSNQSSGSTCYEPWNPLLNRITFQFHPHPAGSTRAAGILCRQI